MFETIYQEPLTELEKVALKELEYFQVLEIISKYAVSDMSREIILNTLPIYDQKLLEIELNQVEEVRLILLKGEEFPITNLSDISQILYRSKIANAVLATEDFLKVLAILRSARYVRSFVFKNQEHFDYILEKAGHLIENKVLEKHIEETIDESGNVRDNASRELMRIRRELIAKSQHLRSRLSKLVKKYSDEEIAREDFYTIREGRFVLPIKVENKRIIGGIIHGASQTGSTVYVEPAEIIELNNDLSLLENEEKREIYKILSNLTEETGNSANEMLKSLSILAYFDSLSAKAKYALDFDGMMPKITQDKYLYLNKVHHPLLVHSKGKKNVIPLSIELDGNKRGLLISGPNAGGKTVALKTIGLSSLLAMSGIYPLGECTFNISRTFTYIGDSQSIQNDLSTFSAQILRLKQIISEAQADSIILIDEIGSGTDPVEGSAIASGILETFAQMNLFFLTTTHHSTLKTFALNREEIENASLEFDDKNLKPTYKFLVGVPGNSYAFSLARNIGISELVLSRARKYLDNKARELEKGIKLLHKFQRRALNKLQIASKEKAKADNILAEYETKFNELKSKKSELLKEARQEALAIVENSNALIERTIKEIKEQTKAPVEIKKEIAKAKKEILEQIEKTKPEKIISESKKGNQEIKVGSDVYYADNNSYGKVIELLNNKEVAVVEINGIKFKLKAKLLEVSENKSVDEKELRIKSTYSEHIKFDVQTRLDLRGERAEAAIRKVEESISDGLLSSIKYITIIHGKGTGALRQAIQEYLRSNPSVISYRDGDLVEGGAGVTIVEI
jgi:DNA mismatch repair protein MutS2